MSIDYDSLTEAEVIGWDSPDAPEDPVEDAGEPIADGVGVALDPIQPSPDDEIPADPTEYEAGELPSD